ncbi:hypothetical protein PFICI_12271 [Pestalotiopsis fici W106-1]|uniref:Zn(2)-C6 fungal-type domain-containing protein n=1 Tax=Pestalotiopsis fici (strain W106-1 / CGMCC3.15140) TaxID=1229662 RepID=W3WQB7_PESFW|nr:uncharacterized protein PFICI_12271 [Pestalotiopsis fici W106-1]ETS75327.1 hypothetical protein PFICI_12271 [Pestalotiopsis fici W106-1]
MSPKAPEVPSCSQCIRAKVSCSGYRDEFALRLRDETLATGTKVCLRKGNNPIPSSQGVHSSSAKRLQGPYRDAMTMTSGLTNTGISLTPEHISLSFFMQSYAPYSLFDYLPDLYKLGPAFGESMEEAVLVPSIALLSYQVKDPALFRLAYARYSKLVKKTQQALIAVEQAKSDSTLVSVLCLALFEAMSLRENQDMANWNAHIKGAAALLELRGSHQFDSWLGQKLYLHASHSISASCVIKKVPAPSALLEVDKTVPPHDTKCLLALRRGRLLRMLAEYQQKKLIISKEARFQQCKSMIEDIGGQMEEMTLVDPIKLLNSGALQNLPASVKNYMDSADSYSSIRWAQAWNILRMLRIFMADALCGWLDTFISRAESLPSSDAGQAEQIASLAKLLHVMTQRVKDSIDGILRSVPFFINLSGEPRFTARSLIGPLYSAASAKLVSSEAKACAADCLRLIGNCYGLEQASEAAKSADHGSDFDSWQVDSSFGRVYGLC